MRTIFPKVGWMLAGVLALYVLSALAGVVSGGPLDPPGAPAPTYKSLALLPPSWMRLLDSSNGDGEGCNSSRFSCVMHDGVEYTAVLDGETGLVWQRAASTSAATWLEGVNFCRDLALADRKGWRLPTASELSTLIDMSGSVGRLPDGHPFVAVQMSEDSPIDPYWTSTEDPETGFAIVAQFAFGTLQAWDKTGSPPSVAFERVWCVRSAENNL